MYIILMEYMHLFTEITCKIKQCLLVDIYLRYRKTLAHGLSHSIENSGLLDSKHCQQSHSESADLQQGSSLPPYCSDFQFGGSGSW